MKNKELIAALDAAWWAMRNHYHDLMVMYGPENDGAPFLKASYAALQGSYGNDPEKNSGIVLENIKDARPLFPIIDAACKRLESIAFSAKLDEAFSLEGIKAWKEKHANDPRTPSDRFDEDWNF